MKLTVVLTAVIILVTACGGGHHGQYRDSAVPPTTAPTTAGPTTTTPRTTAPAATGAATTGPARATTTTHPATSTPATVSSGGLTVTFAANPARAARGAAVAFTITAREAHAPGALGYQLSYGDGSGDQNAVAQYCVGGQPGPASETWHTSHAYQTAGTYVVSVTVRANCTSDRATANLSVMVT